LAALLAIGAPACDSPRDAVSGRVDPPSSGSTDATPIVLPEIAPGTAPIPVTSEPGLRLEPGETIPFDLYWHCGVGLLADMVNGESWRTDEADEPGWIPAEWMSMPDGFMTVDLVLAADAATLTATRNGRSVTYVPTTLGESDFCA